MKRKPRTIYALSLVSLWLFVWNAAVVVAMAHSEYHVQTFEMLAVNAIGLGLKAAELMLVSAYCVCGPESFGMRLVHVFGLFAVALLGAIFANFWLISSFFSHGPQRLTWQDLSSFETYQFAILVGACASFVALRVLCRVRLEPLISAALTTESPHHEFSASPPARWTIFDLLALTTLLGGLFAMVRVAGIELVHILICLKIGWLAAILTAGIVALHLQSTPEANCQRLKRTASISLSFGILLFLMTAAGAPPLAIPLMIVSYAGGLTAALALNHWAGWQITWRSMQVPS